MTETYWQIGKYIVEYEQGGQSKVAYGTSTLTELSKQLTARFGRGFSRPNLVNMRKFYLYYPNCQTVSDNLFTNHQADTLPNVAQKLRFGRESQGGACEGDFAKFTVH